MKIKLSDYLAQAIVDAGICQAFSVVGGGAMHLNDSFGHQPGLDCLYEHHEQACAMAAEAYARINNKPALLCVTTGPGGTNAITGVLGGWLDSIPMLVISGQVRYDNTARWSGTGIRSMGDQEFDILKAVDCMIKYGEMVIDPLRIRFCIEKSLYLSQHGRPGPCWLDIPTDVQAAVIDTDDLTGFDPVDYENGGTGWSGGDTRHAVPEDEAGKGEYREPRVPKVSRELAQSVIEKIKASERPVFMAGNGIRIAGAHEEFKEVAERLGVPVITGWNSQDCIFDEHPLYVGRSGNRGDRPGNLAVQNSDLVFSVGNRLSIRIVGYNYETWAREAYVIAADIDEEELKKPSVHIEMPLHCDAKDLLGVMADILREEAAAYPFTKDEAEEWCEEHWNCSEDDLWKSLEAEPVFTGGAGLPGQNWIDTCQFYKSSYPTIQPKHLLDDDTKEANVYALCKELGDAAKEGQMLVMGIGSACVAGGHSLRIKRRQRFISNDAVASMGYDLPAAIGVYCATLDPEFAAQREGEPGDIILLTGDGSIQMNIQELQTIVHHQMPVKIFLINNGGYHSIRQTQKSHFADHCLVGIGIDSGDLSFPDMSRLAPAYGLPYFCARHNSELHDAIEKTLNAKGPVMCEIFVTIDQNFEPRSEAKVLPDGTMVSPPLEDLSPFLPDEEMDSIMIVPRVKET